MENDGHKFSHALIAGSLAGLTVDSILFPVDTIKTRLQSKPGFWKTGGFRKLYSGIGSLLIISGPNAATFFATYEVSRNKLNKILPSNINSPFITSLLSAPIAEIFSNIVRVPFEVIKQRSQASVIPGWIIFKKAIREEKLGLYKGLLSTLSRDVPFSLIQMPVWESSKNMLKKWKNTSLTALDSSLCGSFSGLIAAIITNPMDVAKTRIMLAEKNSQLYQINFFYVIKVIYQESGIRGLYAGSSPRIALITLGGTIFLGGYDFFISLIENLTAKHKLKTF